MLTKFAVKTTDATRRAALALAVQLPEDVTEARAVLTQLSDLLESFLIRAPRDIWNRPAVAPVDDRGALIAHDCALCWTLVGLVCLVPMATMLASALDCEAVSGFVLFAGVAAAALVFGQLYGVIFSVAATVAHNFFVVAPSFAFSIPTRTEVVRLVGYIALAIVLPMMANAAAWLRAAAIRGAVSRPAAVASGPARQGQDPRGATT